MPETGLILINAYSSAIPNQAIRLRNELTALGVNIEIRRNDGINAFIKDSEAKITAPLDFCVYLDKDKYVARLLEKQGVRLFNRAEAIENCDDKMITHIVLSNNGIKMPDTLPGLLCYDDSPLNERAADKAAKMLGYPVVAKLSYGSMGKGVFKADNREELIRLAERLKPYPHLFQKYISSSSGKDMRVIVIGGNVLGGILRYSNNDFRSNIGLGGHAETISVPDNIRQTAIKAATLLNLDYCGIDFLLDADPLLCEVNSNAFFDAFEQTTGINVAKAYAEHIIDCLKK